MLELRNIDGIRSNQTLFSGLNLLLQPGQLLRVQEANGAGKTSLLRLSCRTSGDRCSLNAAPRGRTSG
jgi:heme exporter protein A